MPIEAHGVAYAPRHQFQAATVGVHAVDGGVEVRVVVAEVARRAYRYVELAVGAEGDELPAVVGLSRKAGVDHLRLGWRVQPRLYVAQTQDSADCRDEKITILVGDSHWKLQVVGDGADLSAGGVHCVDLAGCIAADEQRAALAPGQLAGVGHLVAHQADAKAFRQPDAIQGQGGVCQPGQHEERKHEQPAHGVVLQMGNPFHPRRSP
ncbi:hypothetical protein D9M71_375910 [compost metagenome]